MDRFRGLCRASVLPISVAACLLFAPAQAVGALGALAQLAGTDACVSDDGTSGLCADVRSLVVPAAVIVSPDGKHAYVAAGGSDAVDLFRRDPVTGALSQPAGPEGCVSETGSGGTCVDGKALDGAIDVALSPDGKFAYVTSHTSDAVAVFARNATTGVLTQLAGTAGCVSETGSGGACADGKALTHANKIIVSTDAAGKNVYVSADDADAIAVFARNSSTGALTQLAGTDGCVSETGTGGACADGKALDLPAGMALSGDGKSFYVGTEFSNAVAAFSRVTATGKLTQLGGTDGCVSDDGSGGACVDGRGLAAAVAVVVTADGKHAYAAGIAGDSVAVFTRSTSTGVLTQLAGTDGCVSETGAGGCANGSGLDGPQTLTLSPGDASLYVSSATSAAVAAFARSASTGVLTQLAGAEACVSASGSFPCATGTAMSIPVDVVVSPDGKRVYNVSLGSKAVDVFARSAGGAKPTCKGTATGTAHDTPVVIPLSCTSSDGEPIRRSIVFAPIHGTLGPIDQAGGKVTYTPDAGSSGGDAFTFAATDLDGTSSPVGATVSVAAAPAPASSPTGDASASSETPACTRAAAACPTTSSSAGGPITSPVGPVTPVPEPAAKVVREALGGLPSTRRCVSRRKFRIRLRQPKGARIISAVVQVNRKRVATRRGARVTAPVDLRGLPLGRFTVRIGLLLDDGRTATGTRKYRTCTPKRREGRRPPKV